MGIKIWCLNVCQYGCINVCPCGYVWPHVTWSSVSIKPQSLQKLAGDISFGHLFRAWRSQISAGESRVTSVVSWLLRGTSRFHSVLLEWHHVCTFETCDMNPSVPMQMIWPSSLIRTHFNTRRQAGTRSKARDKLYFLVRVPSSILHSVPAPSSGGGRGLYSSFYHVFNGVVSQRKEEKLLTDLSKFWTPAPCVRSGATGPFCGRVNVYLRERHGGKFTLGFHQTSCSFSDLWSLYCFWKIF